MTMEIDVQDLYQIVKKLSRDLDLAIIAAGGTPGVVDHGVLSGLTDDDHGQYLNIGRHDTTTRHALGTVVSHDAHSALSGLAADDHAQYLRTDGTRNPTGSIIPNLSDAYDLGSTTNLWRRLYASEFDTFVLKANAISVVGGMQYVGKGEGTLPTALSAGATTYDFGAGHSCAPSDFLLFRTLGQVEYIQVGTLISGNNYNITRNLDGSGADAWPIGAVYFNLGYNGTGRIELDAVNTPRIAIKRQGTTYNTNMASFGEPVRIGDLASWDGSSATSRFGIALGSYNGGNGNYLMYDAINGFVLKGGGGKVNIDANGAITVLPPTVLPGSTPPGTYPTALVTLVAGHPVVATGATQTGVLVGCPDGWHDLTPPTGTATVMQAAASGLYLIAGESLERLDPPRC